MMHAGHALHVACKLDHGLFGLACVFMYLALCSFANISRLMRPFLLRTCCVLRGLNGVPSGACCRLMFCCLLARSLRLMLRAISLRAGADRLL